jgi:hypothetical protein
MRAEHPAGNSQVHCNRSSDEPVRQGQCWLQRCFSEPYGVRHLGSEESQFVVGSELVIDGSVLARDKVCRRPRWRTRAVSGIVRTITEGQGNVSAGVAAACDRFADADAHRTVDRGACTADAGSHMELVKKEAGT